jgi:hypothetical protein
MGWAGPRSRRGNVIEIAWGWGVMGMEAVAPAPVELQTEDASPSIVLVWDRSEEMLPERFLASCFWPVFLACFFGLFFWPVFGTAFWGLP